MFRICAAFTIAAAMLSGVQAESHTISFVNNCGFGTPTLELDGQTLSTGQPVTINGPIISAIAFLQTGSCGENGEGCTTVNITLQNPTNPGTGSATDITTMPPYAFSVTTGFGYFNGCDGVGLDCTEPNCPGPFTPPGGGPEVVSCDADNVNIEITFCG